MNLKEGIQELKKEPTLKDRFDKYIKNGFRGGNVEKWNREIEDIESQMPFKDDEEHDKWLQMSEVWNGEPEWLDMSNEIFSRLDQNYKGEDKAGEIANSYFKKLTHGYKPSVRELNFSANDFDDILNGSPYKDGIDWDRNMDYISGKLGIKPSENISQLYRKGNRVYGVEGQEKGEPIEKLLYMLNK